MSVIFFILFDLGKICNSKKKDKDKCRYLCRKKKSNLVFLSRKCDVQDQTQEGKTKLRGRGSA